MLESTVDAADAESASSSAQRLSASESAGGEAVHASSHASHDVPSATNPRQPVAPGLTNALTKLPSPLNRARADAPRRPIGLMNGTGCPRRDDDTLSTDAPFLRKRRRHWRGTMPRSAFAQSAARSPRRREPEPRYDGRGATVFGLAAARRSGLTSIRPEVRLT